MTLLLFMILSLSISTQVMANQDTYTETRSVTHSGGTTKFEVVWVNLNSEQIRVEAITAKNKIGQVDTLGNVVNSATDGDGVAIAGINGTFFEAYTNLQPLGTVIQSGEVRHMGSSGSAVAIDAYNKLTVDPLLVNIAGGINEQWEWPYNWYSWNINHFYSADNAVMIFDKNYDSMKPEHDFTSIRVEKGIVTDISVGGFDIPTDGFLLLTKDQEMIDKFTLNGKADYRINYYMNNYKNTAEKGEPLDYSEMRTVIGAGPTLVKAGKIVLDPVKEGFTEEKILTNRGQRSLVGVRADGYMAMASIPSVTMNQLAEIAVELKLVDAINLDGGASSGVYYNGSYIVEPGRNISNALVVKRLHNQPIKVTLNGKQLLFDTEPYADTEYNRTLVPLRKIAEALGAVVGWDGATSSITITRYDTQLRLKVGSRDVYVNNVKKEMELPVVARESRSYVPIRFITEYFGGTVDWDGPTKTVKLIIDSTDELIKQAKALEAESKYDEAIVIYKKALDIDDNNMTALKSLAFIYNITLKDSASAIPYYEQVVEIDKDDINTLNRLAWAYYNAKDYESSLECFLTIANRFPDDPSGYYGVGICYILPAYLDEEKAKEYFQLAIDKGITGNNKKFAEDYLNK